MKAIKEMNKANANEISKQVMAKLREIEELLGVKFNAKGGRFDEASLMLKIEAVPVAVAEESGLNPEEMKLAKNLKAYGEYGFNGIYADAIGKEIVISGKKAVVVGLTSTRSNASVVFRYIGADNLYKSTAFEKIVKALAK